jgi:hypothetical protein
MTADQVSKTSFTVASVRDGVNQRDPKAGHAEFTVGPMMPE